MFHIIFGNNCFADNSYYIICYSFLCSSSNAPTTTPKTGEWSWGWISGDQKWFFSGDWKIDYKIESHFFQEIKSFITFCTFFRRSKVKKALQSTLHLLKNLLVKSMIRRSKVENNGFRVFFRLSISWKIL